MYLKKYNFIHFPIMVSTVGVKKFYITQKNQTERTFLFLKTGIKNLNLMENE
ncbi:MAG: hypothetical protein BAJALOKI3v1_60086 [Promethearchaeota archaeon]|nr:MAG: hypothetical protein BAJALOKI3v1_60086 [Candidatus Lokiarchaeota archaeon]